MTIVLKQLVAWRAKRQMVSSLELQETTSYKMSGLPYRGSAFVVLLGFLNMQTLAVVSKYCMQVSWRASFAESHQATTRARLQYQTNASMPSRS